MVHPLRPWETLEDNIRILSTSYIPDAAETLALRSRMAVRLEEIFKIDRDIWLGSRPADRTLARRQALVQTNTVAQTLLAPVRRLPAEILGEIFTCAIPSWSLEGALDMPPNPYEDELYPEDVRLVLRQVCRLWNIVALNTPRLWSTLTLHHESDFSDFEMAIIHSKACHLDIYIEDGGVIRHPKDIVELLRPEMYRIQRLIIAKLLNGEAGEIFPRHQLTDAPSLKFLITYEHHNEEGSPSILFGNIHAPNLELLALLEDSPWVLKHFSTVSLRNLRRLFLQTPKEDAQCAKKYLKYLAQSPYLAELEISCISPIWKWKAHEDNKIPFLFLKSLVITESDESEVSYFLGFISAPILESLRISVQESEIKRTPRIPIVTGLKALQAERPQSLQKLELEYIHIRGDDTLSLPSFSSLVILHFSSCFINDAILVSLTPSSLDSTWPCPSLSQLTFIDVDMTLPGEVLFALIRGRTCPDWGLENDPSTQYTHITLDNCPVMTSRLAGLLSGQFRTYTEDRSRTLTIRD